ncbi:hypothetical protein LC76P1_00200 [Lysinibacillus phage LC76P1]|nr:hypothetical protein LC76P1_00200 [Lysinibacillus phage LC76P1]
MLNSKESVRYDVISDRERLAEKISKNNYESKVYKVKDIRNLNKLKQLEGLLLWYINSNQKNF